MDNLIQTSFIPKQVVTAKPPPVNSGGAIGLFSVLSFIVLLLSVLFAGGTYAYKMMLQNEIYSPCQEIGSSIQPNTDPSITGATIDRQCGLSESLTVERDRLQSSRLEQMAKLDYKMKKATAVLDRHLTMIPLFNLLSQYTLKTVRFTRLDIKDVSINLEGIASSYEDVAVQEKDLNNAKGIINPVFSDLNLNNRGDVTFKLSFQAAPSILKYSSFSLNNLTP
ncbi:MAG: PilN domain-containing protein [Patescibacteria group bacterium]